MKLGDFFKAGPQARAVEPRPIEFTAVSSETILPGGTPNPNGRAVAAKIQACLVLAGGDIDEEARAAARKYLEKLGEDPKTKMPGSVDQGDFMIELTYQKVARVLREWDPGERKAGAKLFENVNTLRSCVVFKEADRILAAYFKFVDDEHPEAVDDATFRESQGAGD